MNTKTVSGKIPTQQNIKAMHLKAIFLKALNANGISRAQLTQELHISFPSVSALVDELLEAGLLQECGTVERAQRGRPRGMLRCVSTAFAVPVAVMTREGYQLSLFDCCGQLLQECFLPYLEHPADSQEPWQPVEDVLCLPLETQIRQLRQQYVLSPELVMCAPGSINTKGRLTSSAMQMAASSEFFPRLERTLGMGICMINSSDADAYAEKLFQPLPEDFVFVHMGRGVGAGIIRKGKIFADTHMRAGEIGHISVDYRGVPCSCGNRGCLERYVNISQITREAAELLAAEPDFDTVARAFRQKDPRITELMKEKARLLAVGISNLLTVQPVKHIVLGGKIQLLGDGFLEEVRTAVEGSGFQKYMNQLTVTYTQNTAASGALGAFWNYLDHEWKLTLKKEGNDHV